MFPPLITDYFKNIILPRVPAAFKLKFQKILDKYLIKYYVGQNATYPNAYWSYFANIDFFEFNMSTNSAEVINRNLKVFINLKTKFLSQQFAEN